MTALACWLGYELRWIQQRHELLSNGRVTDEEDPFSGAPVTAPAPGFLWLFGEQGHAQLSLTLPMKSGSHEREDLTPTENALVERVERLFPEAVILWYDWDSPPGTSRQNDRIALRRVQAVESQVLRKTRGVAPTTRCRCCEAI